VIDVGADCVGMLAGVDQALDGEVERIGAIEREDKMIGIFAVEKSA